MESATLRIPRRVREEVPNPRRFHLPLEELESIAGFRAKEGDDPPDCETLADSMVELLDDFRSANETVEADLNYLSIEFVRRHPPFRFNPRVIIRNLEEQIKRVGIEIENPWNPLEGVSEREFQSVATPLLESLINEKTKTQMSEYLFIIARGERRTRRDLKAILWTLWSWRQGTPPGKSPLWASMMIVSLEEYRQGIDAICKLGQQDDPSTSRSEKLNEIIYNHPALEEAVVSGFGDAAGIENFGEEQADLHSLLENLQLPSHVFINGIMKMKEIEDDLAQLSHDLELPAPDDLSSESLGGDVQQRWLQTFKKLLHSHLKEAADDAERVSSWLEQAFLKDVSSFAAITKEKIHEYMARVREKKDGSPWKVQRQLGTFLILMQLLDLMEEVEEPDSWLYTFYFTALVKKVLGREIPVEMNDWGIQLEDRRPYALVPGEDLWQDYAECLAGRDMKEAAARVKSALRESTAEN